MPMPQVIKKFLHVIVESPSASKCIANALHEVNILSIQVISVVIHANVLDVKMLKMLKVRKNPIIETTRKFKDLRIQTKSLLN